LEQIHARIAFLNCRTANNPAMISLMMHAYKVRPRKDYRGVDLISDALPFGRLWFADNCTQSRTAWWDRTTCDSLFVRYGALLYPIKPKPPPYSPTRGLKALASLACNA